LFVPVFVNKSHSLSIAGNNHANNVKLGAFSGKRHEACSEREPIERAGTVGVGKARHRSARSLAGSSLSLFLSHVYARGAAARWTSPLHVSRPKHTTSSAAVVIDAPAVVAMATGERGTVAHHWPRVRRRRSLRAAAMLDPQPVGGAAERPSVQAAEPRVRVSRGRSGAGRVRCAPPPGH
jgi:hypothetical protein